MNAQTGFLLFLGAVLVMFLVARTRPAPRSEDTVITAAVNEALSNDFAFNTAKIDVKTFDGVVILGGFAREFEQSKRAVEIARAVPGVKSVDNRISIRSEG